MHNRPTGLLINCLCALLVAQAIIASTNNDHLRAAGGTLALITALRVFLALAHLGTEGRTAQVLRQIFPATSLIFAGLVGLCATLAVLTGTPDSLTVLVVGYAMTVGAGIAVGNAARPPVVIGQMLLTFTPLTVACFIEGSPPLVALGLILPCMSVALTFVTMAMFTALGRQVRLAAESERLAHAMRVQSLTDGVTGLNNRTGFTEASQALIASRASGQQVALFWIDLRRFKEVNDMLGHHVGDEVLRLVADRLVIRAPDDAVLARFGSDEFLLAVPLATRIEAEILAGALSAELAAPMRVSGQRIESGASLGVALLDPDQPDLEHLMQHAGLALYYAKAAGQHQVCFFNHAMTRNLVRRKEIEAELRGAIQRDELSIYFQPIVDLKTGRIRAFEALVRWFHPERGEIPPQDFIPVAEDTGLIITLGNWITRMAARTAVNWPEDVTLAVNLSPVQIHAPGAALGILAALRDAGLPARRLELEVTENLFVADNAATAQFMDMLAVEGVRFALDDFGTGYSSLHYINKYPFRTIKVDRSFVSGPNTGRKSDAIIRAVAEMGATLEMEIVAEGLETAEQVETVRRAGCTLGQGYHFSRAVPAHLALRLLQDEREGANLRLVG
ncbi:putative bifunctional diguanylate cyclase/phosphodiesterase [Alteraurantiacibacter buctensis]|uniref:EAL domain-containing protein n=1 Tax=Alteraurantiacibacter buctensis TaxID=1503981 RepID=A0A844YSW6_9SPHN|nr:EAL domain-containing protein [Alteraurantiacibacter buctensis]MXO71435.1 EAL domain-containing protein [Alteraurantiacibacter buctensis]